MLVAWQLLNYRRLYYEFDLRVWHCFNFAVMILMHTSTWSSGMIPASGAGGPGFDSRSGPFSNCMLHCAG